MTDELLRTRILEVLSARERDGAKTWLDASLIAIDIGVDLSRIEQQIKVLQRERIVEIYRARKGWSVRLAPLSLDQSTGPKKIFLLRRFNDWSRGDWIAAVGLVIAFVACIAVILAVPGLPKVFQLDKPPSAVLRIELLDPFSGFEIKVSNQGNVAAQGIEIELEVWTYGAPGRYAQAFPVNDLGPQSDFTILGSLNDPRLSHTFPGIFDTQRSISGYIVASCTNCAKPRAWAFHITGGSPGNLELEFPNSVIWKIAEFRYPSDAPRVGQCVDFPAGACADTDTSTPSVWKPKT